jgi:hypothetical protein
MSSRHRFRNHIVRCRRTARTDQTTHKCDQFEIRHTRRYFGSRGNRRFLRRIPLDRRARSRTPRNPPHRMCSFQIQTDYTARLQNLSPLLRPDSHNYSRHRHSWHSSLLDSFRKTPLQCRPRHRSSIDLHSQSSCRSSRRFHTSGRNHNRESLLRRTPGPLTTFPGARQPAAETAASDLNVQDSRPSSTFVSRKPVGR